MNKRNILITGASKGIGRALAVGLSGEGTTIYLAARTATELTRTAEQVRARGGQAFPVPFDLADHDTIETLVSQVTSTCTSLDVLINNAFGSLEVALPECEPTAIYDFFAVPSVPT